MHKELSYTYKPLAETILRMTFEASRSIDLLLGIWPSSLDFFVLGNFPLRLRCLLPSVESINIHLSPGKRKSYKNKITRIRHRFERFGWEVRLVNRVPSMNCLIRDSREIVLTDVSKKVRVLSEEPHYLITDPSISSPIIDHFDKLWDEYESLELVYEQILKTSAPNISPILVTASETRWGKIFKYLSKNPQHLFSLDPLRFEELVAELLFRDGMEVELTERSGDGGRDILAWTTTDIGRQLYLVECKRYNEENPVGVSIVRALYGVVEAEKATGGIIVTTSEFTKGATNFAKTLEHRLWLKDYYQLLEWIRKNE